MDLSVVIVNYNNFRVLPGCLSPLMPALDGIRAEVILSDNGSTDGSLAWVRAEYPTIRILENGANLGFAEANNRAFVIASGRLVLLLNPDTIVQPGAIPAMISFLDRYPRAGAVGCKLLNVDRTRQISARCFPSLLTYFMHFTGLAYRFPKNRYCGRFNLTYWNGDTERRVDWICGAVLMARREVWESVGGLDPYFFLTYDEVDWCHRLRQKGYEVWYTPAGEIVHLDRQSEPQSNPRPEARLKYLTVERNSRVRYFVKHRGVFYAALVEMLHVCLCAVVWIKAGLIGSNQTPISILQHRLVLQLYGRTIRRLPRALWHGLTRRLPGLRTRPPFPLFVNPYLADDS